MTAQSDFDTALENFCLLLQAAENKHFVDNYSNLQPGEVQAHPGSKYVKIVKARNLGTGDRYVYCFIDKSNGDILKPAGWAKPAKHARGNIYGENPLKGCGPYGVDYLR